MHSQLPAVDVVIAALNEEPSIGKCVDALKNQDYPAELVSVYVVVDKRTTDNTAKIASAHGAKVIISEVTGIAPVRNLGFEQGSASLVAFLDAHCIPCSNWISAMSAKFADPSVGGCQGGLESICDSPRVEQFLKQSLFSSDQRMNEHTVEARFSPYPWLVGGNSMFRRRAIEEAGPLQNCYCDDTDRSWKVVLEGYQLTYATAAQSIHHDHASLFKYLKKHYAFGVGAAQLAYSYGFTGQRKPDSVQYARTPEVILIDLLYQAGYFAERLRQLGGTIALPKRTRRPVQERFRPRFSWTDSQDLQISRDSIFWTVEDEITRAVHLLNGKRFEFDGVGNLIFRQLIKGRDKEQTCAFILEHFEVTEELVEQDVDEFVNLLQNEGLLNARITEALCTTPAISRKDLPSHSRHNS